MNETKNSYRDILKATSLFGGVQIINVLISIAKSKLAAVLIGPAGMGIVGLLNSTLNIIIGITKLGLDVSAVKEIAATREENKNKAFKVVNVLQRLTWFTGLFGSVIMLLLSSWLSEIVFGDDTHTYSFIFISIAVLFNQLTVGNHAILQGLRRLKKLAKATLWGSFSGLIVITPLYYYYGIKGIVPAIILMSFFTFLFSWIYVRKEIQQNEKLSLKETLQEGKSMMKLGFVLSLGGLATILTIYGIQIFITKSGGVDEVGLYNAAFIVINAYVGVIFVALSKDYFPRLSSIVNTYDKMLRVVNQQAYVAILLITPIIIIFLAFTPFIIKLLFTEEFLPISELLTFGILATLFKAVSWAIGYIIVAKGHSKLFIITEVVFSLLLLLMSVFGYIEGGLTGVGISYLVYYIIYLIGVKLVTSKKYKFRFTYQFYKVFFISIVLCAISYLAINISDNTLKYTIMFVMIITSSIFSVITLDKETDLVQSIKNKLKKNP